MEKQERRAASAAYRARLLQGGVFQIRNTRTGRVLLGSTTDLHGSENRLRFAQMTDTPYNPALREDWKQYGASAFCFEVLEQLKQKETQTASEFADDVQMLLALWQEKLTGELQY